MYKKAKKSQHGSVKKNILIGTDKGCFLSKEVHVSYHHARKWDAIKILEQLKAAK